MRPFKVSSRRRDNVTGSTSSDFYISLPYPVSERSYYLVQALINNSMYTINSTNNKIYFNENSTDKIATLTSGLYDTVATSTIMDNIKSAMDTASSGYNTFTVAFDNNSLKLTISAGNAFSFTFGTNTTATARRILGYNESDTTAGTSQLSPNIINLTPSLNLNINVNGIGEIDDINSGATTFAIPIDVGQLLYAVDSYATDKFCQHVTFPNGTRKLHIVVTDDDGNTASLNGVDWMMTLLPKDE